MLQIRQFQRKYVLTLVKIRSADEIEVWTMRFVLLQLLQLQYCQQIFTWNINCKICSLDLVLTMHLVLQMDISQLPRAEALPLSH